MLLYISTFIFAFGSFFMFDYFALLSIGKSSDSIMSSVTVRCLVCAINGFAGYFIMKYLSYGSVVLAFSLIIPLEYVFMRRCDFKFHFATLVAVLLNASSAFLISSYGIELFHKYGVAFTEEAERMLIILVALIMCFSAICYLRFSKKFPNESFARIMLDGEKNRLLFIYWAVFGVFNLASLYVFAPHFLDINIPVENMVFLTGDLAIKVLLTLLGSYLIIYYLSKLKQEEKNAEVLDTALEKSQKFRHNAFVDSIVDFCVNLSDDTLEEGGDFFKDEMYKNGDSFTEVLGNFIKRSVHPDDHDRIMSAIDVNRLKNIFEDETVLTSMLRLSIDAIDRWANPSESLKNYLHSLNDEYMYIEARITKGTNTHTGKDYLYISIMNVDKKMKENMFLRNVADKDSLTGLYNRSAFNRRVEKYYAAGFLDGTFYSIDVDDFKAVNDDVGHAEGDKILVKLAHFLLDEFRNDDLIARMDGDEFAIFSPGMRSLEVIEKRVTELIEKANKSIVDDKGESVNMHLSIGAAISPLYGDNVNTIYKNAYKALYKAKNTGGNKAVIFSKSLDE